MKRRHANTVLTTLAAAGGAIIAYSLPLPLLTQLAVSTGISAIVPGIMPLGQTAHVVILCIGAFIGAATAMVLLPRDPSSKRSRLRRRLRILRIGFLTGAPRHDEDMDGAYSDDVPMVRRSDAHPDAPPRQPVFASRDLGEQVWPPADQETHDPKPSSEVETLSDSAESAEHLDMPRAPEPLPWDAIQKEMDRLIAGVSDDDLAQGEVIGEELEVVQIEKLSVRQLTERLELGFKRRKAADEERPAPGSEIAEAARQEIAALDETETGSAERHETEQSSDLDAALAALRRITARAG